MPCYDDDFDDDDDDDDLEFFNVQPSADAVRLTHRGLDLQQGTQTMVRTLQSPRGVTTFNSPTPSLDFQLGQLAEKVAAKVGEGLSRSSTPLTPRHSTPRVFKGNVPMAQFSVAEATALVDHLSIVNEYAENHAYLAGQGTSLYDFALDKFINGDAGEPTDEVLSALRKQSTEFANKHMASRSSP